MIWPGQALLQHLQRLQWVQTAAAELLTSVTIYPLSELRRGDQAFVAAAPRLWTLTLTLSLALVDLLCRPLLPGSESSLFYISNLSLELGLVSLPLALFLIRFYVLNVLYKYSLSQVG